MRVTAVLPLHNHEKWVCEALQSLLDQTRPPDAIVVVDDGSTDDSLRVAGKFLSSHGCNAQLLHNDKACGPAAARNAGIRTAWEYTDVFALLDSDDLYRPNKVEKSLRLFGGDANIAVVYSDFETFRPDGLRIRHYKEPYSYHGLLRDCIVNCDSLVSKKAFETVGLFDEEMRTCEDYDLWIRISEKMMISHIAECLVDIRLGDHSSTATVPRDTWEKNWARIREKMNERRSNGR